jgi:uncharacterized repeat protein (TIGR02543 family)
MISHLFKRFAILVVLILVLCSFSFAVDNENARYVMDAEIMNSGHIGVLFIKGGTSSSGVVSDGKLYFGMYDASLKQWQNEQPVGETAPTAKEASMAIDSDGVVHVAYTTSDDTIAYTHIEGNGWAEPVIIESNNANDTSVTDKLWCPDIAVDDNGKVHIAYIDSDGAGDGDYHKADGMYATNKSGSFVKTVIASCSGWRDAGVDYDTLIEPIKISYDNNDRIISYKIHNYSTDGWGGRYNNYTLYFNTNDGTAAIDNDTNSSGKIYESVKQGDNNYTLISKDGKYFVVNNTTLVEGTEVTTSIYTADMTLDGSDIYYASINGSDIIFYQDGTTVEGTATTGILSGHNKCATVITSDGDQYIIYTGSDTDKSLVISTIDGDEVDEFLVPNIVYYQVDVDPNNGDDVESTQVEEGDDFILPSASTLTVPEGKIFAGWDIDGTIYDEGDEYTVEADTTITAQWDTIITTANCTITKPVANETPDMVPVSADSEKYSVSLFAIYLYEDPYDVELSSTDLYVGGKEYAYRICFTENEGYRFVSGSSTLTINGDTTTSYGTIADREVVYAAENAYQVTFNLAGGSGDIEAQNVIEGEYAVRPAEDPTSENGWGFTNWYLEPDENTVYDDYFKFNSTPITEPITLEALWSGTVRVETADEDMGQLAIAKSGDELSYDTTEWVSYAITKTYSDKVKIGAKANDGYSFVKWTNGGADYSTDTETSLTADSGNMVLTAVFEEETYSISYDLDDGNVSSANPTEYTISTNSITLNNPTKESWEFIGWTGTDLTEPTLTVTIPKGSTGNRTYTANYRLSRTLRFSAIQDGTTTVVQGATIQLYSGDSMVTEFVSTSEPRVVNGLGAGEFTLKTVIAPDGYLVPEDKTFTISETGALSGITTSGTGSSEVCLIEYTISSVNILAVNASDTSTLDGVTIQALDKEGNVLDEWSSGTSSYSITGLLTEEEYTIKVTAVPDATLYDIPNDITFTISTTGTVTSTGSQTMDGTILVEVSLKHQHTTQYVEIVPATYESTGTMAHYICTGCDLLFSDESATTEVTAESLVIPIKDSIVISNLTFPTVGQGASDIVIDNSIVYGGNYKIMGHGLEIKDGDNYTSFNNSDDVIEYDKIYALRLQVNKTGDFDDGISSAPITVNDKEGIFVSQDDTYIIKIRVEFSYASTPATYTVTADLNGATVTGTYETEKEVDAGTKVTLPSNPLGESGYYTITPPEGTEFEAFEISGDKYNPGEQFIVSGDTTVKYLWKEVETEPETTPATTPATSTKPKPSSSSSSSSSGGGSSSSGYKVTTKSENATISPSMASVKKNASQEFTFDVEEGYEIVDVLVDGKSVGAVEKYTLENVSEKHSIEVVTAKIMPIENVDEWAKEEMDKANEKGLIPETFKKKDATKPISRLDFAAVAVKLYEAISGKIAEVPSNNPFIDTNDEYVLKAYGLEITNGTSENTFTPDIEIPREQMATMLTRALSKAGINVSVDLESTKPFADDNDMHDWGRPSVYFMASKEIIKGIGDNLFNAVGNSKIEEAIAISLRSVETFGK